MGSRLFGTETLLRYIIPLATGLLVALAATAASAMDFGIVSMKPVDSHTDVVINAIGAIASGDDAKLHRFVAGLPAGTNLVGIVLNSPGGIIDEAIDMADAIHRTGLSTTVNGQCASACVLMFLAGKDRYVVRYSRVGVHSAALGNQDNDIAKAYTIVVARKSAEFGATPSVLGKMVTTTPDEMAWLTPDDLLGMNVHIIREPGLDYEPGSMLKPGTIPAEQRPLDEPDPTK